MVCKKFHREFELTVVYAPNDPAVRLSLWEQLLVLKQAISWPWLLLGDFNKVLEVDEMVGVLAPSYAEIWPFQHCLAECEVEDMRSKGPVFTWTNGTIWSKTDRAFVNSAWMSEFPAVDEIKSRGG